MSSSNETDLVEQLEKFQTQAREFEQKIENLEAELTKEKPAESDMTISAEKLLEDHDLANIGGARKQEEGSQLVDDLLRKIKELENERDFLKSRLHLSEDGDVDGDTGSAIKLELPSGKGSNHDSASDPHREYSTEELDISVFDTTADDTKDSEDLTRVEQNQHSRFRKFQGHKKGEGDGNKENDPEKEIEKHLEEKIKNFKERLNKGETEEQIALSMALDESSKKEETKLPEVEQKTYSPKRSFVDLLQENERRNEQQRPGALENSWTAWKDDGSNLKDTHPSEKSNLHLLIIALLLVLVVGGTTMFLLNQNNNVPEPDSSKPVSDNQKENTGRISNPPAADPATTDPVSDDSSLGNDAEISSVDLKKQMFDLLSKFHDSSDLPFKASLCYVPNRTLVDMKNYSSREVKASAIIDIEVAPEVVSKGKLKIITASVKTNSNGEDRYKQACFIKDENGSIKLDWYTYVNYEVTPWKIYLEKKEKIPSDWHLTIDFNGDLHPDYSKEEYVALTVRSWSSNAVNSTNAILNKKNPMYERLVNAYELGQRTFILKVHHLGDIANSLLVEEVVSLSEFYTEDIKQP